MKKTTLSVLLACLIVPMTVSANSGIKKDVKVINNTSKEVTIAKRGAAMPVALKPSANAQMLGMPKAEGETMVWDFEDATAGLSPFTAEDRDGDGYNWQYYNNDGVTSGQMSTHEGLGVISSASYVNDGQGGGTAVTPDNWLISPEVTLGGFLSFWAMGQDSGYAAEVFGVYVTVDGENWTQVGTDKTSTSEYVLYEYDLSAYDGQTGRFAIVHHNVTDMFMLNVDDITFNPSGYVSPEPGMPTELTATPAATSAELAWVAGENNGTWNLRWRPYTDPSLLSPSWTFPIPGYETEIEGWQVYDADGDGNNWGLYYSDDTQTDACFGSASWDYAVLTPDNWLITPEVGMGGTLTFKTWNSSASYLDKIMVYYAPADWQTIDDFVAISDFIQPGTTPEEFEIDLSEYEGSGVIAFRHYDSSDMMRIFVDDITIDVPGGVNPADLPEWTVVEDVANPYTLEGLVPETTYEAQVMAYNEDGDKYTDWTESTIFTTLTEGGEEVAEGTWVVGSFNGWNQTAEGGRVAFDEENRAEVALEAGDEFKIITANEDGTWTWLGGVDDNQVGYFLIVPEYYSHNLTLLDGANFRVTEDGIYHINLVWNRSNPDYIVVTRTAPTAISTVGADVNADNAYYNLLGVKFNGMPTTPGIYIHNGKKVIIK